VQLVEHKPLTLRAATTHTTGAGETSLEFSATHRNLFGRAERGHVTAVITASQSSVLQASLARPVLIGPTYAGVAELQVGQSLTHSPLSSHRELKRDLVARWRYMRHELAYEWAWRHVTLLPGATERMLSEGGDSVKSAVKHRYMIAQLDDLLTPTRGFALRFVQELAGLGGDVKFLKHELDVNYNVPLAVKGMALNFLFKAGTHVPLFDSKSYVTDRFFLGGATIFRAFANKGVGPRFRRDSYGGDVMYNASAYLSGPLPLPKSSIGEFRGHVFGHVGSLISINRKKGLKDHIETLVEQYRASVGVGVVLKTVFGARVELNYSVPLKYSSSDRVQSLQLGIAFDFL
jgi:outer membrane protein insertion porin family